MVSISSSVSSTITNVPRSNSFSTIVPLPRLLLGYWLSRVLACAVKNSSFSSWGQRLMIFTVKKGVLKVPFIQRCSLIGSIIFIQVFSLKRCALFGIIDWEVPPYIIIWEYVFTSSSSPSCSSSSTSDIAYCTRSFSTFTVLVNLETWITWLSRDVTWIYHYIITLGTCVGVGRWQMVSPLGSSPGIWRWSHRTLDWTSPVPSQSEEALSVSWILPDRENGREGENNKRSYPKISREKSKFEYSRIKIVFGSFDV